MIFILLFCFSEEITQMEKAKFGEYCQVSFHEHRVLTSPLILLPAETSHHIWLPRDCPLRLYAISCFLRRLLCLVNSFLQRLSVWFSFLLRVLAGSRIMQAVSAVSHFFKTIVLTGSRISRTVSAGSHFFQTIVLTGSRISRTVSAEAKYDGQSL